MNTALEGISKFKKLQPDLRDAVQAEIRARIRLEAIGVKLVADAEAAIDAIVDRQNALGPRV